MKRQPAVIGPTPPFVRWAVNFDCSLRDNNRDNIPAAAFQQLRALAEISEGVAEGRCVRGYCFSRSTSHSTKMSEVKAIDIREVVDCFGTVEELNQNCASCPANGHDLSRLPAARWAGCFGYLSADPTWCLDRAKQRRQVSPDLIDWFDEAIASRLAAFSVAIPTVAPNWYGLWRYAEFGPVQLRFLNQLLKSLAALESGVCSRMTTTNQRELARLTRSTELAIENQLTIAFELIPAGFSDGTNWEWESHCRVCRFPKSKGSCESCGDKTAAVSGKRRRVLGDRPYLRISEILDLPSVEALVDEYLQRDS